MILPQIQFKQYDGLFNPSGTRNIDVGASGWVKNLDTSASGVLDFGFIDISETANYAGTKMLLFRPLLMGSASKLYNFRFFLSNISAWTTGTYSFKWRKATAFTSGIQLNDADDNVPTVLPPSGNITASNGSTFIQTTVESGVSQYIWLDVKAGTDVLTNNYGGPGAGSFRYKLFFDFI